MSILCLSDHLMYQKMVKFWKVRVSTPFVYDNNTSNYCMAWQRYALPSAVFFHAVYNKHDIYMVIHN